MCYSHEPKYYTINVTNLLLEVGLFWGFTGGSDNKESVCSTGYLAWTLGWEYPLEKGKATPVFLPGEFHEQGSLVDYSPWGCKESETEQWTLP